MLVGPVARGDTAGSLRAAQARLDQLAREVESLSAERDAARRKLDQIEFDLDRTRKDLASRQAELQTARDASVAEARALYKYGSRDVAEGVDIILNAENQGDFARVSTYLAKVQQRTVRTSQVLDAAREDLEDSAARLDAGRADQARTVGALTDRQERIEGAMAEARALVARYSAQLSREQAARARAAFGASSGGGGGGGGGAPAPAARVSGSGNGRLPDSALVSIGVGDHRLTPAAAEAFKRLFAAAQADGVTFGVSDSYRSYAAQVSVARRKGIYGRGGWAAVPGTSNHGWGVAVDLALSGPALSWMRRNARQFGYFETVPRESWHWEYRGG